MKAEDLFEAMEVIDGQYLLDARKMNGYKKQMRKARRVLEIIGVLAACIAVIFGIGAVTAKFSSTSYKALAAEIGKEEMQLGATMPTIIYADKTSIIMYDYIGIWVYDLKKGELIGFCDFHTINMTQIQGYPCVFVEATSGGKYVKFYMSDGSRKYLYDVEKDSYKEVENYDISLLQTTNLQDVTASKSLSEYAQTYQIPERNYVSYTLDFSREDDVLRYKDLVILVETEAGLKEFRPFATE